MMNVKNDLKILLLYVYNKSECLKVILYIRITIYEAVNWQAFNRI